MLSDRWRSAPVAVFALALLILFAGIGIIVQYNFSYSSERAEQTRGLAKILGASAAAAVDFDDPVAAQEAVNAFRINDEVRWIGLYNRRGQAIAGYDRTGAPPPSSVDKIAPVPGRALRIAAPIESANQRVGTVFFEVDREDAARKVRRYLLLFVLAFGAALVVTGLGIAQHQLRTANRQLSDRAEALSQANELLEEQMEQRAKAEDQLRQSHKMQALGQLTGGIAHDFNNLLTVIQGSADMLCRADLPEEKRFRFAKAIVQAAENAAALTSQLLAFARRQPLKPERLDVNRLLREMDDLLDRTMGERIEVAFDLHTTGCGVEVDKAQLQAAILNIASNARDAMSDGGRLTISTKDQSGENGLRTVAIAISDTGHGMDDPTLDRVFEPFFTTKATGRGTGLGLSQVYGFASQSGGDASVRSEVGSGTTVTIILPCLDSAAEEIAGSGDGHSDPELAPMEILIVEDNEEVGAFAETLLAELGHSVTRAASAEKALQEIAAKDFDIVFSDVVMPGMGGLKLAELLAKEKPDLPVVLATGYSQEIAETGSGGRPVILKPYRLATLSAALSAAISGAGTA